MSLLLFLLIGLIVVTPALVLSVFLPGWIASLLGLPLGAWLAWLAYQAATENN